MNESISTIDNAINNNIKLLRNIDIRAFSSTQSNIGTYNPIVGGVTTVFYQDIDNAGNAFDHTAIGTSFLLTSTSNSDLLGVSGIQLLYIEGVDNNFNLVSETISLNGTTGTPSVNIYKIVNNTTVILSSGNNVDAIGTINARGAHNNFFSIVAGYSSSYISRIAVPAGYTYSFDPFEFSCADTGSAYIRARVIPFGLSQQDGFLLCVGAGNSIKNSTNLFGSLPEKTIFYLRGIAVGAATSTVSGFSAYIKFKNSDFLKYQQMGL